MRLYDVVGVARARRRGAVTARRAGGHGTDPRAPGWPTVPGRQRVHLRHHRHAARPLHAVGYPHHRRRLRGPAGLRRPQGCLRHGHRRAGIFRRQRGRLLHLLLPGADPPALRSRVLRSAGPGPLRRPDLPGGGGGVLPRRQPDGHTRSAASLQGRRPPLQRGLHGGGGPARTPALPRDGPGRRGPRGLPPGPAGRAALAVRRVVRHAVLADLRRRASRPVGRAGPGRHRRSHPRRARFLRTAGPRLQRHRHGHPAALHPGPRLRRRPGR